MPDTKVCSGCHRTLPTSSFTKCKRVESGIKGRCRECTNARKAAYRRTLMGNYVTKKCHYSNKGKAANKKYEQSEKGKQAHKKYVQTKNGRLSSVMATTKRRALKKNAISTLTANEWENIKKQYKYHCVYCGEEKKLTMDHIIPLSKGGHHVKENILPACKNCNSQKNNKMVLLQLLVGGTNN